MLSVIGFVLATAAAVTAALHFIQLIPDDIPLERQSKIAARLASVANVLQNVAIWGFVIYVLSGYKPELRMHVTELCFWLVCCASVLRRQILAHIVSNLVSLLAAIQAPKTP